LANLDRVAVGFCAADRAEPMTRTCETRGVGTARSTSKQSKTARSSGIRSRQQCGPLERFNGDRCAQVSLFMVGGACPVGEPQLANALTRFCATGTDDS
jgi:hypothetical protein